MKHKRTLTKLEEAGSTRFNRVGKVEFWLTSTNAVFLKLPDDSIVFPTLQGSIVRYDEPHFRPAEDVHAKVYEVLHKQQELRKAHWVSPEEEELAWTFN